MSGKLSAEDKELVLTLAEELIRAKVPATPAGYVIQVHFGDDGVGIEWGRGGRGGDGGQVDGENLVRALAAVDEHVARDPR